MILNGRVYTRGHQAYITLRKDTQGMDSLQRIPIVKLNMLVLDTIDPFCSFFPRGDINNMYPVRA